MLTVPLPFVIALFAAVLLVREIAAHEREQRNIWLIGFLGLFLFQELLIGLRFGYGQEWLRAVQPLTAALLPPLAYLGFRPPHLTPGVLIHVLPLLAVMLALAASDDLLDTDTVLAISNLCYAAALIQLGLRGGDALGWAEIGRLPSVQLMLWLVTGILIVSGLVDAFISYDFWKTKGANTARIAGWASVVGLALTGLGLLAYRLMWHTRDQGAGAASAQNARVFDNLSIMMAREKLYLDADINLNRIARRMALPVRDVSRAINAGTGSNVSQYVNGLRIEEACRLLRETDMAITHIAFAAGFNTKSNFNREFARIKKTTPSQWRADCDCQS